MKATFFKTKVFIFIFFAIFSVACNRHVVKFNPNTARYYPAPPDTARLQFLTCYSTSSQVEKRRSGFGKFLLGENPVRSIDKPYGIASSPSKIYICDTGTRGLEIIDLEENSFKTFHPGGKGQMKLPLNCSLDNEANLYVADGERKQVIIFDSQLNYLAAIGDTGTFKPTDVFVYDSLIFIANLKDNKVNVYNKTTYKKLYSFPNTDVGQPDWLYSPTNLFVNDSLVYVSDMGDSKVKIYSLNGTYLTSIGSLGKSIGQFARLKGIAVDKENRLFAVDASFENVQIFNQEGKILLYFGGPYNAPGDMWLPAKVTIDYENLEYFQDYVDPEYTLEYLVYVTNQYGPDKVNVYGFIRPKPK